MGDKGVCVCVEYSTCSSLEHWSTLKHIELLKMIGFNAIRKKETKNDASQLIIVVDEQVIFVDVQT